MKVDDGALPAAMPVESTRVARMLRRVPVVLLPLTRNDRKLLRAKALHTYGLDKSDSDRDAWLRAKLG